MDKGTKGQRDNGSKGQRDNGTKDKGTKGQRDKGTGEQRHKGTKGQMEKQFFLVFAVLLIFNVLKLFFVCFGSLPTSIVCTVGEVAGVGSVAVAVSVSDR